MSCGLPRQIAKAMERVQSICAYLIGTVCVMGLLEQRTSGRDLGSGPHLSERTSWARERVPLCTVRRHSDSPILGIGNTGQRFTQQEPAVHLLRWERGEDVIRLMAGVVLLRSFP